jgi:hypothetical protein
MPKSGPVLVKSIAAGRVAWRRERVCDGKRWRGRSAVRSGLAVDGHGGLPAATVVVQPGEMP